MFVVQIAPIARDTSNNASSSSVVMTSRRLAFTLQALSQACTQWSEHGAAVGIRIHASNNPINPNCKDGKVTKGARTPDHLTIATRANFVVTCPLANLPTCRPMLSLLKTFAVVSD